MRILYKNRKQAGYLLAEEIEKQAVDFDLVLAIPRGGVVPAHIIAQYFNKEMDLILSRRIGNPNRPDPGFGAVAPDGSICVPQHLQSSYHADQDTFIMMAEETRSELNRQTKVFRGSRLPISPQGRRILLVDDGIATGSTVIACIDYLKRAGAASIILATPVCAPGAHRQLVGQVDGLIALEFPGNFMAVGQYYEDFSAIEDEEILVIMQTFTMT